jgi:outer membrane protein OmpA-like peptidoglycan-associated protein
MLMKRNAAILAVFITALFLIGACAESQLKVEPIATSENPTEQVNRLQEEIRDARDQQLDVLSPLWFGKAEASLKEAKEGVALGDELSGILKKVADGRAQLQVAQEKSELVKTALKDAIKARERALAAGAANLGADYEKTEKQFIRLAKAIEENNLKYAQKNSPKVIQAFDELELRAIKEGAIGTARDLIKEAEDERARKIAPVTLAMARKRLQNADAYISENRYAKEEIRKRSNDALFQARRLVQVMQESKKVQAADPEQTVLWFEGMLHETANKLSAPEMRDKDFQSQLQNILGSIDALQLDNKSMAAKVDAQQTEIENMRREIVKLEGRTLEERSEKERLAQREKKTKERLAAERRFYQMFNEVRGQFGPTEAEVYKQGNSLVIRLKAIQFPVGTAVIKPSNYTLLRKVQQAIQTFNEPDVVIEGHTDSSGSDEANERLSQKRAEAVREYFVANGTLSYERIYPVGYGSARPLASNETAEGRAINRRIDIVITPQPLKE